MQSITDAYQTNKINDLPKIFGGRYDLSSKEFTPSMVTAIFNNLKKSEMKNNFTIGINDDVTGLSLGYSKDFQIDDNMFEVLFYQDGAGCLFLRGRLLPGGKSGSGTGELFPGARESSSFFFQLEVHFYYFSVRIKL